MSDQTLLNLEAPTTPSGQQVDQHPLVIPVSGAGDIRLKTDSVTLCGSSVGLPIGVSWGSHGYAGGVIDAVEVEKLRDRLTAWLETERGRIDETRRYWDKRRTSLR